MSKIDTDAADIHGMVVSVLDRAGYRPFGSDGSAWEHPDGTKVTTGYTGGQLRLRRFVPGNDRFERIPPVIWDIRDAPHEAEVAEFIGVRAAAPELSAQEFIRVAQMENAEDAPESFRQQLITALGDQMDALGMSPGRFYAAPLADAALEVIRGQK